MHKLQDLLYHNKAIFLSLDHGLENGPKEFSLKTINTEHVLNLALESKYNGIIMHKGLAEKYYENYRYKVPLILKLNGRLNLNSDYIQTCSVLKAVKLGATAVGYNLSNSNETLKEFVKVHDEAREHNLPVIVFLKSNKLDTDSIAHMARASLELGADIINFDYNNDHEGFKWILKSSGKTRALVNLNTNNIEHLFNSTYNIIKSGGTGLVLGHKVLHSEKFLEVANLLNEIVFQNKTAEYALDKWNKKN